MKYKVGDIVLFVEKTDKFASNARFYVGCIAKIIDTNSNCYIVRPIRNTKGSKIITNDRFNYHFLEELTEKFEGSPEMLELLYERS